jgi:hypothetical protein
VQTPGVRGNPHTTFSSGRNGKAAELFWRREAGRNDGGRQTIENWKLEIENWKLTDTLLISSPHLSQP